MKTFENPEIQVKTFDVEDIMNESSQNTTPWG